MPVPQLAIARRPLPPGETGDDDVNFEPYKLGRKPWEAIESALGRAILSADVLILNPAQLPQPTPKGLLRGVGTSRQVADPVHLLRPLLRDGEGRGDKKKRHGGGEPGNCVPHNRLSPAGNPPQQVRAPPSCQRRNSVPFVCPTRIRQTQSRTALRPKELASRTSPHLRVAGGRKRRAAAPLRTHEARKLVLAQPPSLSRGDILERDDQPRIWHR